MFDMLIVIVFWEERLGGQEPSQRESLEVVTNMACVVGIAKRMYSDFQTFGIAEFLVYKEQRQITYLILGPEIQIKVSSF